MRKSVQYMTTSELISVLRHYAADQGQQAPPGVLIEAAERLRLLVIPADAVQKPKGNGGYQPRATTRRAVAPGDE